MPLNADQLDAFWMVVQTGSYQRAAEALFITQSAVTQRVQALEAALGQRLFVRAGRGVALTQPGERLVRHCRSVREAESALLAELSGVDGLAGRLAVATGSASARLLLLPLMAALGRSHPGLDLALVIEDDLDEAAWLAEGRGDAVLGEVPLARRGIRSERVGALPHVLVASPALAAGWGESPDAATLRGARGIDFHAADPITFEHLALCLPGEDFAGLRRHFVNDARGILDWVLAGGGFSALPVALARAHLAAGALVALYPEVHSRRPLYWSAAEGAAPGAAEALKAHVAAALAE